MESSNPENQGMAERHDASSTVRTTSEGDFEEVDDGSVGAKGESDSAAPMDVTSEWTHLASDTAELERGEESLEAGDNGNLQEGADDGTESSPEASVPAGQIESVAEDTSSPVPTSGAGNLLEDVEGSMSKSPEADDTREGEIEATSVKRTDDDVAGAGLEHKMEAMFGDESSSDDVKTADKPSADELKEVDSSKQSKTAEAIVDDSQPDEGEDRSRHEDDEMEGEKDEKSKLNQTPDESNLEFMMEALHADKLSATEPSVLKQSDTPGMELKDVLQALTGDHDADESVQHSSDSKTKNSKKAAGKTKKSSDQSHDSDANNSSSEQPKKKLFAASTSKRVLRNTRSQSIEQASSDESDDETTEKELRSKIKREKDDSEDEDDSQPGNRSSRSRSKLKSAAGKASKGNAKKLDPDLISKSNKVCILPHCRQRCYPQLGISLHRFPFANNPMRNIWLKLVEQRPPGPITAYICSKHFTNDDYYNDKEKSPDPSHMSWRKLKPKAFPTVNLAVSYRVVEEIKRKFHTAEQILEARRKKAAEKESNKKNPGNKGKEVDKEDNEDQQPRSLRSASTSTPVTSKTSKAAEEEVKDDNTATPSSSQPTPKAATIKKRLESDIKPRAPGTNCSVPSCGNNLFKTRADGLNISYYRFPFNEELAQKWIKKMGDPDLNCRTARICSDHFSEKDFEGSTGGKKNLKPKAVPSLYLTERKPRKGDSDNEDSDDESDRRKVDRKRRKGSKKMDTSAIVMPLPMIPEPEIKSEPPSDEEDVGQEYVAEDTTADDDLLKEIEAAEQKSRNTRSAAKQENAETPSSKRWRGRPRKLLDVSHVKADKLETPKIKTVTLSSLEGPKITLEKLSLRVIKAAESGSLRVRIKESPASKAIPHQKPCPKSKKKRPIESEESSDDDPKQSISSAEAEKLKKIKKPGPLSKKRKLLEKLESQEKHKAQAGRATGTSLLKSRKVLKTSDDDEEEEDADDPAPMSPGDEEGADSPSSKSSSIVKVKPAELPKFLVDKKSGKGSLKRKLTDDAGEDVNSILSSDVSEHQKIAKLVDQRILEHTKIIDQRPAGPQQLVDHNKILQGSALVLKKLAEKTGKTLPASQIIPLNVPDNTSVTPGRTIVLKKVSDPGKLGLKPPISKRGESSKMSPNASIFKSSPTKSEVPSDETPGSVKPCSPLEKIRDYDNLMRKYLNAVADKSLVSRKFMEAKESQRTLETKLEEKEKELELVKKKVSVSQTRLNKIVSSLEHFLTPNQIKLALQETKKVAWTPEEMLMAFTIKHLSKACYLFLRHKLNYPLPGISSLQRWMGMLHKDKGGDDEDNIADDDALDKDESAEAVQQRDETGVMNEITGTLEEINASSIQSNKDDVYTPKVATTMTDDLICPTQSSSPFQIVYENDSSGQGTRKVVIVKKVLNVGGENKAKSMLQISASENDVNVNNIAGTGSKNEIYKMLPRAKTISMGGSAGASPSSQPKRVRYVVTKNTKEKEKLSFNRLPKVRQEPFLSKPPRIQVVKTEPDDSMHLQNEYLLQSTMPHEQHSTDMVDVNEMAAMETIVKPEDVMSQTSEVLTHQSIEESHKQIFTLSDLAATQGETIVESVDVEGGVDHEMISAEQLIQSGDLETITIMKEDGQFEQHQIRRQDAMGQQTFGASGLEQLVHMATSEEQQQITFATHHVPVVSEADGGVTPGEHYAQIAFAATQGSVPGEITLHEDMNNMTAVVINDIDEEQLNTLLMSNVVEQKDVTAEEAAAAGYQHKEIVYQTITDDKNVIVLQPDSQAFVEEDEGPARQTYSGYHRVFVVDEDGCLVPEENGRIRNQEVQDDNLVADFGFKFNDPTNPYSIHNLIENFAIRSPTNSPKPR